MYINLSALLPFSEQAINQLASQILLKWTNLTCHHVLELESSYFFLGRQLFYVHNEMFK
jgi:hypothetical protein